MDQRLTPNPTPDELLDQAVADSGLTREEYLEQAAQKQADAKAWLEELVADDD